MTAPIKFAAALLLLLPGAAPARIQAQIHSPQVNIHRHHTTDDLSWVVQYAQPEPDGNENRFVWDPRFKPFLRQYLTAPQSFWGKNKSLHEAALEYLGGPPGRVLFEDNRYFTADACVQHFCPNRGLLWIDTALPKPLVVFAALDWISDNRATDDKSSTYTMWVFPSQPIDPAHLPVALTRSVSRWTSLPSSGSTDLQNITRVFLVDPDGTPHTVAPSTIGAHNDLPAETSAVTPTSDTAPKAKP